MSISDVDWAAVNAMSGNALKDSVFEILRLASEAIQDRPTDDPAMLAVVPRLANLIEDRPELASFREAYSALARSVGLWNYIDKKTADVRDELVAEAATIRGSTIALHREQIVALDTILSGRNLILSAPTSFGKSLLVDALIMSGRFRRIAIVLPTIALLDEFRRRLDDKFGGEFDILMHHSEKSEAEKIIFLGTQERLINRTDLGRLDIVVVDEFYKLDPSRQDERSMTLNAAVYKLLGKSNQFFFLGPNIDAVTISNDSRWQFEFIRTRFSTVAVDTIDLKNVPDKKARLSAEAFTPKNWPALIFVSSPDRANAMAKEFSEEHEKVGSGSSLAAWMRENYGSAWQLSDSVEAGIAVHHGRIPRALASRFVKLFNQKDLPILICTSTLIEGVNTSAKSVLIYDKKISRMDYDFFTFSNIRGRAGRLGMHHVGNVFLFNPQPTSDNVSVSAPLFGDLEAVPDEFVVHIEDADTTEIIDSRVDAIATRSGLEPAELRRFSSLGLSLIDEMKSLLPGRIRNGAPIQWSNWPDYNEIEASCEVICHVKRPNEFGVFSYKQLAMYLSTLRSSASMREFFKWHSSTFKGDATQVDGVFKFLRAAEYSLPELFSLLNVLILKAGGTAKYDLFVAEMPRWFRAEPLKILEEQGVPIQISERFWQPQDTVRSLRERLRKLADEKDPRLSRLELGWIKDAIPRSIL